MVVEVETDFDDLLCSQNCFMKVRSEPHIVKRFFFAKNIFFLWYTERNVCLIFIKFIIINNIITLDMAKLLSSHYNYVIN